MKTIPVPGFSHSLISPIDSVEVDPQRKTSVTVTFESGKSEHYDYPSEPEASTAAAMIRYAAGLEQEINRVPVETQNLDPLRFITMPDGQAIDITYVQEFVVPPFSKHAYAILKDGGRLRITSTGVNPSVLACTLDDWKKQYTRLTKA